MKLKKTNLLLFAVALEMASGPLVAQAEESMTVVAESPQDVFTPKGFDDNDNAQVVLAGSFENFCFQVASTPVHVVGNRVYIDDEVSRPSDCADALMYIPYSRVVDIGQLSEGNYEVWVSDGSNGYEERATLPIAKSTPSAYTPDEELYASVRGIAFHGADNGDAPSLTLVGTLTNTCMAVGSVQVSYRSGNVVEVLPKAEITSETQCTSSAVPFSRTISLPDFPSRGDVLIHVRSLGGQSINRVITELDRAGF